MKTIHTETTQKDVVWTVSEWSGGEVAISKSRGDAWSRIGFLHESQIDSIPADNDCPAATREAARREICAKRELREEETRHDDYPWIIGTMSVEGDFLKLEFGSAAKQWHVSRRALAESVLLEDARRLAFLDNHRALADDEIFTPDGERRKLKDVSKSFLVVDEKDHYWMAYGEPGECKLTGQSLINARKFLDARLPADRVRFDCGALGRMSMSTRSVAINEKGSVYDIHFSSLGADESEAWNWGRVKITDPIQRQKVRDFARGSEKPTGVEPPTSSEGVKHDAGKPPLDLIPWRAAIAAHKHAVADTTCSANNITMQSATHRIVDYLEGGTIALLAVATYEVEHLLSTALKKDAVSLWSAYIEIARVLDFGAKKYARDNWRKGGGLTQCRVIAAALRHIAAYREGEELDPETGLSHLAHAACELLFALTFALEGRGDDRWCVETTGAALSP